MTISEVIRALMICRRLGKCTLGTSYLGEWYVGVDKMDVENAELLDMLGCKVIAGADGKHYVYLD